MSNILKSEIAPKGMKFNINDFMISDKYATILTVISYPKTIWPGYLSNITSISGIKVVVKHIPILETGGVAYVPEIIHTLLEGFHLLKGIHQGRLLVRRSTGAHAYDQKKAAYHQEGEQRQDNLRVSGAAFV